MTIVGRVNEAVRADPRSPWVALLGIAGVVAIAALGTRYNVLPIGIGAVLAAVVMVLGFRWPLLPLVVFTALIPIESVIVIDGLGTVSRFAGLLFAATYALPRLRHLVVGAMPLAGWAYLAWATVSVGWAIDPGVAWAALATLIQLFIIATLIADFVVRRPTIVRSLLWTYSISAAVTAIIGTASYIAQGSSGSRAVAIQSQDPAQFAAILLPALVFGLHEVLSGEHRLPAAGISLLTMAGVVVSGTRGAWLAVIVVVLLFVLPRASASRRIVAVAALAVLMGIVYQLPGVAGLVAERTGSAISTGGAGRTDIWEVSLTVFESAPLTGVGFANFPVALTPEVVRASGVSTANLGNVEGSGAHNVVVATAIELGPIGLLLLALFLGPLLLRRGPGLDAAAVQIALASLLTQALFLDIITNRKQVWLVIGLAAGLAFLARRNAHAPASGAPEPAIAAGPAIAPEGGPHRVPRRGGGGPTPPITDGIRPMTTAIRRNPRTRGR